MTYRIVVGVDGSPHSIAALRWSLDQAEGRSGQVTSAAADSKGQTVMYCSFWICTRMPLARLFWCVFGSNFTPRHGMMSASAAMSLIRDPGTLLTSRPLLPSAATSHNRPTSGSSR